MFSVMDHGTGIPASAQPLLFRPFTQADTSVTRRFGGTGLGLSVFRSDSSCSRSQISKRLVELMEGDMWFESREGEGSTFYFEVLFKLPEHKPEELAQEWATEHRIQSIDIFALILAKIDVL